MQTRIIRLICCLIVLAHCANNSYSQWTTSGNNIYNTNPGNVGIGTTNPTVKLDVQGGAVMVQQGANVFYRAYPYLSMGNSSANNRPYIAYNALLTTSAGGTNAFTPTYNAGSGLLLWGDPGGSSLHFLQKNYNNGTPPYDINSFTESMTLAQNGYLGLGTASPSARLSISNTTDAEIAFGGPDATNIYALQSDMYLLAGVDKSLRFGADFTNDLMILNASGNLLIGKTTQTNTAYKLDVNGNIRANKVVVNTTGADFVFDSAYQLLPLNHLEKFVQQHHHLPGIAPAKIMQEEGMDVGTNQTKLLQKVEELTLYIIDQDKQLKQQQGKLEEQDKLITAQHELLKELQATIKHFKDNR